LLDEDYSELVDVYSFGVLLTEFDTHKTPYYDSTLDESAIIQRIAVGQLRPTLTPDCPDFIRKLAQHCMQADPALRPTAARVVAVLQKHV